MKSIKFQVNGIPRDFIVSEDRVLLDVLRDDLGLTGAKQSCDRKGQCGACMVIVNGKAVLSCLVKVASLEGAEVITVEGLGTPENPHLIQEAYVLAGAIQCGFCTPGMIMATKALLDSNPNPGVEQIKQALRHNLCRCTGYKKIIEAVQLAGKFIRGESSPAEVRKELEGAIIGKSHPRPSAMAKACGTACFSADFRVRGALELAVLRSDVPHARIGKVDTSEAEKMPGVAGVLRASDIKGTNFLKFIRPDRPVLCVDKVRYIGDPILAVAAETREQAEAALKKVKVELIPLPALLSPEESVAPDAPQIHDNFPNLCVDQPQIKGDAEAALKEAAAVVEADFSTQTNHQAPLEPEASVAYWEDEDAGDDAKLVIIGRSIDIHNALSILQEALGWENMSYREAYSGGQFGIKLEIMSEGIAGAAAIRFRRPIRYIPSLHESMLMTSKRHAFKMHVKLAADADGKITAYCNDLIADKGAYYSFGHVLLVRCLRMLSGSYDIPNIGVRARLAYTNNPFGSAARGAGPPQVNYALECAVQMLAEKMGIDPLEFRLKNSLQPGQSKSTGMVVNEWPLPPLLEAMRPHWERAVREARAHHDGKVKRGVGLATGSYGIGAPMDAAAAAVQLDTDGGVSVFAAAADPGEGTDSMLSQYTAEYMGIPLNKVRINSRDTDTTAATGSASGSRITFMVGGALLNALEQLKSAMEETGARDSRELAAAGKPVRYLGRKKSEGVGVLDPKTGQGPAFESQVHAVQMAELEVNTETGDVKVLKMTTAVDAGTVINPQNLTGQMEGGMDMGVGFALRERYIAGKTKDWVTFKFPTIKNTFEMEMIIKETPRSNGPMGSTGVGEMCMVPTAPAVVNAIEDATGVWICDLPVTPDKVRARLAAARQQ